MESHVYASFLQEGELGASSLPVCFFVSKVLMLYAEER